MAKSERVLMPLDLRRAVDRDPEVVRLRAVVATLSRWLVAVVVVTCLLAVAFFLASCAADLPSIAADDIDAADAGELDADVVDGSGARPEVEPELETSPAIDSAKPSDDTAPDVAGDTGTHDTAPDVVDVGPCVTKCVVAGGVPLGYFCSLPSDCCSGHCGGPDRKCLPPADACAGCWNECP